jgi:transcription initiation factor TFIIB
MPTSPIDYIPRFCSGLNLKGEVQAKGIEILRQAAEKELTSGRGPTGVAAAAITSPPSFAGQKDPARGSGWLVMSYHQEPLQRLAEELT